MVQSEQKPRNGWRPPLDPFTERRLQRGVQHLHALGPRATYELLLDVAHQVGGLGAIASTLVEYERRLTPEMVRRAGGRDFPPRQLHLVPR